MKNIIFLAIMFSLSFLYFYSCSLNSNDDLDDSYPTIIYTLSDSKLEELQSEFDKLNNNQIGTQLDQFGYTGYSVVYNASETTISDTNEVKQMAISSLVKNSKFTNVSKESLLKVDRLFQTPNNSWKIFFDEQEYNGLKVDATTIQVYLNSNGVYRIDNHFFEDIYIPYKAKYSESEAKLLLIGKEIKIYPNGVYTVNLSSFSNVRSKKVIIPVQTDTQIEFRVTWEIYVGDSPFNWTIYIDIITGEEIKLVQNFVI